MPEPGTKYCMKVYTLPEGGGGPRYRGWIGEEETRSDGVSTVYPADEDPAPPRAAVVELVSQDQAEELYLTSDGRLLDGEGEDGFHLFWWAKPIPEKGYPIQLTRTEHRGSKDYLYLMKRVISEKDPTDAQVIYRLGRYDYYAYYSDSHTAFFEFIPAE